MVDTYALAERFRHYLRVTDVTDGVDAVETVRSPEVLVVEALGCSSLPQAASSEASETEPSAPRA